MTEFEAWSVAMSAVALGVALLAEARSRRISKNLPDLQEIQRALASSQYKSLIKQLELTVEADLRASIVSHGKSHRLILMNAGLCAARNIRLARVDGENLDDTRGGWDDKDFPIDELLSGDSCKIHFQIFLGTRLPVTAVVTWDDDSDRDRQRQFRLKP